MHAIDLALRAGGAVLLGLLGAVLVWRHRATPAGWLGGLLAVAVAAHLLCPPVVEAWGLRWPSVPILLACISVPAVFWLFARALFKDGFRLRAWHALPLAVLLAAGMSEALLHLTAAPASPMFAPVATVLSKLVALALIVASLVQALAGSSADLIDARRDLRVWVVGASGAYMVVVIAVELYLRGGNAPPELSATSAAVILLLALGLGFALLRRGAQLIATAASVPLADMDAGERLLAERLRAAVEENRVYRREGLTIGSLAKQLGAPEYRLRRVINRHLGFRNFNDFLNHHRVRDACTALADPAQARVPILNVALDLGYLSLSPFNRAFKAQTGLTPSEYRRAKLSISAAD
jgi:AraC-like DNA-binding protein